MGVIQDMYLNDTHKTHIKVGGTLRYSFPSHQLERATCTTIMMPKPVAWRNNCIEGQDLCVEVLRSRPHVQFPSKT